MIVNVVGGQRRFVQFFVWENGDLIAEVVSNAYLAAEDALSPEEEARLIEFGYRAPQPPRKPNWRLDADPPADALIVADTGLAVLKEVFEVSAGGKMRVTLLRHPLLNPHPTDDGGIEAPVDLPVAAARETLDD